MEINDRIVGIVSVIFHMYEHLYLHFNACIPRSPIISEQSTFFLHSVPNDNTLIINGIKKKNECEKSHIKKYVFYIDGINFQQVRRTFSHLQVQGFQIESVALTD